VSFNSLKPEMVSQMNRNLSLKLQKILLQTKWSLKWNSGTKKLVITSIEL